MAVPGHAAQLFAVGELPGHDGNKAFRSQLLARREESQQWALAYLFCQDFGDAFGIPSDSEEALGRVEAVVSGADLK